MYHNPQRKRKADDAELPNTAETGEKRRRLDSSPAASSAEQDADEDFSYSGSQTEDSSSEAEDYSSETEDSLAYSNVESADIEIIESVTRQVIMEVESTIHALFPGGDGTPPLGQFIFLLNSESGNLGANSWPADQPGLGNAQLIPRTISAMPSSSGEPDETYPPLNPEEWRDTDTQTGEQPPSDVEYTIDPAYIKKTAEELVGDVWGELLLAVADTSDITQVRDHPEIQRIYSDYLRDVEDYISQLLSEESEEDTWKPYA